MNDLNQNTRSRHRKRRIGTVINNKAAKSITVRVDRRVSHPIYKKIITRSKKYHVHDHDNRANIGDKVCIEETRPLSKLKCWRLINILSS